MARIPAEGMAVQQTSNGGLLNVANVPNQPICCDFNLPPLSTLTQEICNRRWPAQGNRYGLQKELPELVDLPYPPAKNMLTRTNSGQPHVLEFLSVDLTADKYQVATRSDSCRLDSGLVFSF